MIERFSALTQQMLISWWHFMSYSGWGWGGGKVLLCSVTQGLRLSKVLPFCVYTIWNDHSLVASAGDRGWRSMHGLSIASYQTWYTLLMVTFQWPELVMWSQPTAKEQNVQPAMYQKGENKILANSCGIFYNTPFIGWFQWWVSFCRVIIYEMSFTLIQQTFIEFLWCPSTPLDTGYIYTQIYQFSDISVNKLTKPTYPHF